MPKLSGPAAYALISEVKPEVPVIFTTGYSTEAVPIDITEAQGAALLQKPYMSRTLAQKVREVLDRNH